MARKGPDPIDEYVANRARTARMMRRMTQAKLAQALGLSLQQVQEYEKGANRIGASRLQQIARVLKVDLAFLFEGAPGTPGTAEALPSLASDLLASPDGLALARAFTRINDRKLRRCIVKVVENIVKNDDPGAPPPAPPVRTEL